MKRDPSQQQGGELTRRPRFTTRGQWYLLSYVRAISDRNSFAVFSRAVFRESGKLSTLHGAPAAIGVGTLQHGSPGPGGLLVTIQRPADTACDSWRKRGFSKEKEAKRRYIGVVGQSCRIRNRHAVGRRRPNH